MTNPSMYLGTTPIYGIGVHKSGGGTDTDASEGNTYKIVSGSYTPSSNTTTISLEHNLGVMPVLFFLYVIEAASYSSSDEAACITSLTYYDNKGEISFSFVSSNTVQQYIHNFTGTATEFGLTATEFNHDAGSNGMTFIGGATYNYFAIG